ncbi:hypothetical protein [Streptomyces uncialis]|uniref:hypothetical protein n=1 Tax=Streptomyces uncialis TaxID=1048205 RepID=UPI0038678E93|nr:hypothetical protein OG268_02385 [Streptomyces uncialis]
MNETAAALAAARWPLAASGETAWLRELTSEDGLTGFMPPALPDAAWVLHSMYEHQLAPTGMSHLDHRRAALTDGGPGIVPGFEAADVLTGTAGEHPGPRWRRLRWAELALRNGDPVVPEGQLPCFSAFPSIAPGRWPVGIQAPSEGTLDRTDWNRLVDILTDHSPQGADTRCLAYYNPLPQGAADLDNLHVRAGTLGDAKALYDHPEEDHWSPSNLWAQDRTWLLCTDHDLWATKVAGPAPLVNAFLDDVEIEALQLPWAR